MKNKNLIKEQNVQGAEQFTNDVLKKAFGFKCWDTNVTGPTKDKMPGGTEAVYQLSSKPENKDNPHVFDKPDGTREWRTTPDEKAQVKRTSKWYCEKLQQSKNAVLNPDQEAALKTLEAFSKNQVVRFEEGVTRPAGEGWDLMDLTYALKFLGPNYAEYINNTIKTNLVVPKVWVLKGAKQFQSNLSNPVVLKALADGYKTKEDFITKNGNLTGAIPIDLSDCTLFPDTCGDFQGSYFLYKDSSILSDTAVIAELDAAILKSSQALDEKTKKVACKTALELYNRAYGKKLELSQPRIEAFKPAIRSCINNYPKFAKIVEKLQFANPVQTQTGRNANYALSVNANKTATNLTKPALSVQRESKERQLKNLIRESLLEIKENKKKSILGESKIVKVRLSIISENVVLKTKKQKDKFFGELLSEMAYLNSQGFDKQVINEGFWDTLKGLFGHAPDGIMEYFKEYMAKWIVKNLTPMDPEGWIGNMIITGIGNLPIGDIPKLTDCNYLTKWISKTAAEGTVRKLTHEKGLDGPFYDILRNSIVDMLDETSLGSKIEEALGSFICPLLGGVKNKMEATTDKLKQKALATS